ncbi:MAG: nucleotidyltransferase family protein [Lachnospiraceae bacterium]|nr:nucleotidyltransferase family protein [Lachnospiraceae bacterium]
MKTIILAAGYATRLYPLTENFPKPLLEVGEKTILDWLIDDIDTSGLMDEYVVISNHKFADIFKSWADKHAKKITVVDDGTSTNETRLGAVRDIQFALEELGIDEDVLVIAGDNVLDFSLVPFVEFGRENDCSCIMCYEENVLEKQQRTAIITVDENAVITGYEEKPKEPKSNLAVPPFYYYKAEDVKRISEALTAGCGYDAPGSFAAWLSRQTKMKAYRMPGSRYDIGNLASYEAVKASYKGIK